MNAVYKERIKNLMEAVKDEPDDLEFVESRMKTFTDYVTHVSWMETRIQRLQIEGITGESWRDAVESLDHQRRSKHEVAMGAINQLNRLSVAVGLEPFYGGVVDDEHRNQVGDVIGDIVDEYFKGRFVEPLKQEDLMADDDFVQAVENIPETVPGIGK